MKIGRTEERGIQRQIYSVQCKGKVAKKESFLGLKLILRRNKMTPREVKMDGAKASHLYPGGTFLKKGHKFSSADEYLSFMEEDQPDQEETSAATSIRRSGRKPESVLVKKLLSTTDVSCLGNAGNVPAAPIFSGLLQALDMYSAQEQTDYTCETDAMTGLSCPVTRQAYETARLTMSSEQITCKQSPPVLRCTT